MNYLILQSVNPDALARKVSELMGEGWTPQGGVAVEVPERGAIMYNQAVVKWPGPAVEGGDK